MASIRRTLSPAHHDRSSYLNGAAFSPSPSPFSYSKSTSSSSSSIKLFLLKHSRKAWRRSLYRCFLFFLIGFLFGMTPFGHVDYSSSDIRNRHDFSFIEIKPPRVNTQLAADNNNDELRGVSFGVESRINKVSRFDYLPRKQLIIVTPTYNRAVQAYFLNRLGQVLRLVQPPLLWIVVEVDAVSIETADLLRKTQVMYRHLVSKQNSTNVKDRGVHQRNVALDHIQRHRLDGIVYFADDDNVYSLQLFESLREIRRFGTWPVAMLAQSKNKAILEGPVCNGSQVIGWHTNEKSKRLRRFHVDMSGFAFNSTILWDPKRWHRLNSNPIRQLDTVKEGFQETTFIEQVVEDESQMEVVGHCRRIWTSFYPSNNDIEHTTLLLRSSPQGFHQILKPGGCSFFYQGFTGHYIDEESP
ncbi:hypothetical protein ACFE04_007206 [Oxalis oulophora]